MEIMETPLFGGFSEEEIRHLLGCIGARERTYRPGEPLLPPGESRPHAGVLLGGGAACAAASLVPGDFFLAEGPARPAAGPGGARAVIFRADRARAVCGASCRYHREMAERFDRLARAWSASG